MPGDFDSMAKPARYRVYNKAPRPYSGAGLILRCAAMAPEGALICGQHRRDLCRQFIRGRHYWERDDAAWRRFARTL